MKLANPVGVPPCENCGPKRNGHPPPKRVVETDAAVIERQVRKPPPRGRATAFSFPLFPPLDARLSRPDPDVALKSFPEERARQDSNL